MAYSKKKNSGWSIAVACILVIAAMFYVAYSNVSQKSSFLEEQSVANALSDYFSKSVMRVSEEDVAQVKYLEVGYDYYTGNTLLYLGAQDLIDAMNNEEITDYEGLYKEIALDSSISNYSDLKYFTGLNTLILNDATTFDTALVAQMPELESLYLTAPAGDLSVISSVEKLNTLGITYTDSFDASIIENKTDMKSLSLSSVKVENPEKISSLVNLETLTLNAAEIESIDFLSGLTKLENLSVYDNSIADITPLAGLSELKTAVLYSNKITDASTVAALENLTTIYLEDNLIEDVSPLSVLDAEKIEYLGLTGNPVTNIDVLEYLGDKLSYTVEEEAEEAAE